MLGPSQKNKIRNLIEKSSVPIGWRGVSMALGYDGADVRQCMHEMKALLDTGRNRTLADHAYGMIADGYDPEIVAKVFGVEISGENP